MIEGFAHLIEASQLHEEGGPLKLLVGCRSCAEIPKELPVVFGGKEYKVALAVRETENAWRQKTETTGDGVMAKKRKNLTYKAPQSLDEKKHELGKICTAEGSKKGEKVTGIKIDAGDGQGGEAQSSSTPVRKIAELGQTKESSQKGQDSNSSFREERSKGVQTARSEGQWVVYAQKEKNTGRGEIEERSGDVEVDQNSREGGPRLEVKKWTVEGGDCR